MKNRDNTLKEIEEFIKVVEELRGENGCPWDKAQTHGSMRMELIEEAYEAAAAMLAYEKNKEADNLREELGDLLLHVIMHGVIAEEEGIFTIGDIAKDIKEKMIHRHPHVFAKEEFEKQEKKKTWEQLKAEEAGHAKENVLPLKGIPNSLPALLRLPKVLKKSDAVYGKKILQETSIAELSSLAESVKGAADSKEREKVISDILYHICNIAWQDKINLEEMVMKQTEDVIREYEPS